MLSPAGVTSPNHFQRLETQLLLQSLKTAWDFFTDNLRIRNKYSTWTNHHSWCKRKAHHNELSKKVEDENWWNSKLMNTPVYFSHAICTQKVERKKLTEHSRWQKRELGNTPTVPKHDDKRPVLKAGLRVELQKKKVQMVLLSCLWCIDF